MQIAGEMEEEDETPADGDGGKLAGCGEKCGHKKWRHFGEEVEASLDGFPAEKLNFPPAVDSPSIVEVSCADLPALQRDFRRGEVAVMKPPFLGFIETETSRSEKVPETCVFPAKDGNQGSVMEGTRIPNTKGGVLDTGSPENVALSLLRFFEVEESRCEKTVNNEFQTNNGWFHSCAPQKLVNGGREHSLSPEDFNIDEFFRLATRVVDGDEAALAALKDLKKRWENKFDRGVSQQTAKMPVAGGVRKPWKNLLPVPRISLAGNPTGEMMNVAPLPATTVGNVTAMGSPSLTISGDSGGQNATAMRGRRADGGADMETVGEEGDDMAADSRVDFATAANVTDDIITSANITGDIITPADITGDISAPADITGDIIAPADITMMLVLTSLLMLVLILRHLPMEFWTTEGLCTMVSGVGKPLYPDAITRACTRLDFARRETLCKVDVEYEWLPPKCSTCMSLGHEANECALNKSHKPTKPPVNVYVPKVNVPPPQSLAKEQRTTKPVAVDLPKANAGDMHVERNSSNQNERGKAIVIYNAFDALQLIDNADEHSRGPNTSNPMCNDPYHQLAIKDIVSEYRLHFLGILETRVRLSNVVHIQSSLLPQWKWFVDYTFVGNRIWLAWDENIIDVHILDLGAQFIHCRVTTMAVNELVIITVVYGASEVIDRRNLWIALETLAQQCADVPWMVGGDFNAV
ncbi:UNVERIFIED_CONTAM: hypothetical protein Sindi_1823500 [Sesamum indicum]